MISRGQVLEAIIADVLDEYRKPHNYPWIIGYSGGKDSTLVAHLVFEMLMRLPPSERTRQVHVVANDTLVESPLVVQHLIDSIREIQQAAQAFGLPVGTGEGGWATIIGRDSLSRAP